MSCETVIEARGLGKCYQLYARPQDRLKQFLARGRKRYFREFWALRDASFELRRGEVLGIVGRNGAGKSTLLQLICGTLQPTVGELAVRGRIAALLELGAGFNPEFTGRENVFMNAAVLGVPQDEIAARFDEIVEFAGLRDFIDQPVKTYSSGMYVRLAFSVATSIDPDILVIDEALSVGDGAFARKSFERIMALKERGATILFCSHSMYQVEALCSRAIWLEAGRMRMLGAASEVVSAYATDLHAPERTDEKTAPDSPRPPAEAPARILRAEAVCGDQRGHRVHVRSKEDDLSVEVWFEAAPTMPAPSVGVAIVTPNGLAVTSAGSKNDHVTLSIDAQGQGFAKVTFPRLPLLKGVYEVYVVLLCERGTLVYDQVLNAATLQVSQTGLEQGLVSLPHHWETLPN